MAADIMNLIMQAYSIMLYPVVTKIIFAIIILLLGLIIGRAAGKISQKMLHGIELNRLLRKILSTKNDFERGMSLLIEFAIYLVTIIWALQVFSFAKPLLYVLAIAFVVVVFLSIIIVARDFFPNALAGIVIRKRKAIAKGDKIKMKNLEGIVVEVMINAIKIETNDKDLLYIPNVTILEDGIEIVHTRNSKHF